MKMKAILVGALAATALATGCVTPTPMELEAVDQARVQARQVLDSFAQALRERNAQALDPLVDPRLKPRDVRMLKRKLIVASSMVFYEDYSPDLDKAIADVYWRTWTQDEASVGVPYSVPFGPEHTDLFTLTNKEGRWYLYDIDLRDSKPGELLNPPDDVKRLLGDKAAELLERLRKAELMGIFYELPSTPSCRYRRLERTWWEKAVQGKPDVIHLLSDLEMVQKFTMLDWPSPDEVSYAHAPGDGVAVFYEIPYVWPDGGIDKTDMLRVEFVFLPLKEGWLFYQLLLKGKGVPWSL